MSSLEEILIGKLKETFLLKLKHKTLKEFGRDDIIHVYQFLLRVYDSTWVLKEDASAVTFNRQIQNFLKIMELGHLATKPDDVADSKKICRLFGAMVDKLESRHTTFLNAAVRKTHKQKPKTQQEKPRVSPRVNKLSSVSSGPEEAGSTPTKIPTKGREIPRTPDTASSYKNQGNVDTVLPAPPLPLAIPGTEEERHLKAIMPTKEIPRTPVFSQLKPSYTSTPYGAPAIVVPMTSTYVVDDDQVFCDGNEETFVVPQRPAPKRGYENKRKVGQGKVKKGGKENTVLVGRAAALAQEMLVVSVDDKRMEGGATSTTPPKLSRRIESESVAEKENNENLIEENPAGQKLKKRVVRKGTAGKKANDVGVGVESFDREESSSTSTKKKAEDLEEKKSVDSKKDKLPKAFVGSDDNTSGYSSKEKIATEETRKKTGTKGKASKKETAFSVQDQDGASSRERSSDPSTKEKASDVQAVKDEKLSIVSNVDEKTSKLYRSPEEKLAPDVPTKRPVVKGKLSKKKLAASVEEEVSDGEEISDHGAETRVNNAHNKKPVARGRAAKKAATERVKKNFSSGLVQDSKENEQVKKIVKEDNVINDKLFKVVVEGGDGVDGSHDGSVIVKADQQRNRSPKRLAEPPKKKPATMGKTAKQATGGVALEKESSNIEESSSTGTKEKAENLEAKKSGDTEKDKLLQVFPGSDDNTSGYSSKEKHASEKKRKRPGTKGKASKKETALSVQDSASSREKFSDPGIKEKTATKDQNEKNSRQERSSDELTADVPSKKSVGKERTAKTASTRIVEKNISVPEVEVKHDHPDRSYQIAVVGASKKAVGKKRAKQPTEQSTTIGPVSVLVEDKDVVKSPSDGSGVGVGVIADDGKKEKNQDLPVKENQKNKPGSNGKGAKKAGNGIVGKQHESSNGSYRDGVTEAEENKETCESKTPGESVGRGTKRRIYRKNESPEEKHIVDVPKKKQTARGKTTKEMVSESTKQSVSDWDGTVHNDFQGKSIFEKKCQVEEKRSDKVPALNTEESVCEQTESLRINDKYQGCDQVVKTKLKKSKISVSGRLIVSKKKNNAEESQEDGRSQQGQLSREMIAEEAPKKKKVCSGRAARLVKWETKEKPKQVANVDDDKIPLKGESEKGSLEVGDSEESDEQRIVGRKLVRGKRDGATTRKQDAASAQRSQLAPVGVNSTEEVKTTDDKPATGAKRTKAIANQLPDGATESWDKEEQEVISENQSEDKPAKKVKRVPAQKKSVKDKSSSDNLDGAVRFVRKKKLEESVENSANDASPPKKMKVEVEQHESEQEPEIQTKAVLRTCRERKAKAVFSYKEDSGNDSTPRANNAHSKLNTKKTASELKSKVKKSAADTVIKNGNAAKKKHTIRTMSSSDEESEQTQDDHPRRKKNKGRRQEVL